MATYYVGPGRDFATISAASAVVRAGDTVHVAAGVYRESVLTAADGTEAAPIVFIADPGVVLMPPGGSSDTGWDVRGDHVTLDGFEIDGGTQWRVGIYAAGSYDTVTNVTVHDIALGSLNNANGGGAIVTDNYFGGVHNDVLNSTVYHVGLDNFDQGIYISTSGEVINNTVYDISNVGIHLWHNATNVLIQGNAVHDASLGILVGGGDYYNGFTGPDDYTNVINNTVYNNDYGISEQGFTGTHNTYVGNLVYNNSIYDYSLQNGNTFTPGDGASEPEPIPPPPTTDWGDIVPPERLERWWERHQDGPQAGHGHHFMALIDLYWN